MYTALLVYCRREDEMAREIIGHYPYILNQKNEVADTLEEY